MTLDAIRTFVGTPSIDQLTAASVDENLQFIRYLVDPRKAEGKRLAFTIAAEGDPRIQARRAAQQCARDHRCRLEGRRARRPDAARAGGFRARQGCASDGRRTAGRARWHTGSKPSDASRHASADRDGAHGKGRLHRRPGTLAGLRVCAAAKSNQAMRTPAGLWCVARLGDPGFHPGLTSGHPAGLSEFYSGTPSKNPLLNCSADCKLISASLIFELGERPW